jgi:hypothetical protein
LFSGTGANILHTGRAYTLSIRRNTHSAYTLPIRRDAYGAHTLAVRREAHCAYTLTVRRDANTLTLRVTAIEGTTAKAPSSSQHQTSC